MVLLVLKCLFSMISTNFIAALERVLSSNNTYQYFLWGYFPLKLIHKEDLVVDSPLKIPLLHMQCQGYYAQILVPSHVSLAQTLALCERLLQKIIFHILP